MGLIDIELRLGVAKDDQDYQLKGYAANSQWIRFSGANVLSRGGWQLRNSSQMSGICRGLFEWATAAGAIYCAIGTHIRLYVHSAGSIHNITPSSSTGTLGTNPFTTTMGSPVVEVHQSAHGLAQGQWVYLGGATAVGGITPGGLSGTYSANPFMTSNGSPIVLVTQLDHGMATNDEVVVSGGSAINGITVLGTYLINVLNANQFQIYCTQIANASGSGGGTPGYVYRRAYQITYVDANNYDITHIASASSSATGGGNAVQYLYEMAPGLVDGVQGTGYSTGGWSVGPYSVSFAGQTLTFNPRTWSFAPFGDILVANPSGGMIYNWNSNWSQRATQIANSPAECLYVTVTSQRQVIAFGCTNENSVFDPMNISWSDINNITVWVPSTGNNAGSLVVTFGSQIVCASRGDNGTLFWTDQGFYFLNYIGNAGASYEETLVAPNFGICGPNAYIDLGTQVFWVTPRGSFALYQGGVPTELQCRSKTWFKDSLPVGQMYKIYGYYDQAYPAAGWLFPANTNECNSDIRYDIGVANGDGASGWSISTIDRTAWIDNPIFPFPLAVDAEGFLYEQENGNSALGNALTRSIDFRQVAEWDDASGQGDRVMNVGKIVQQANVISGSLGCFVDYRRYPNGPVTSKPTTGVAFAITNGLEYIPNRGQGRSLGFRLISNSTNDNWTAGVGWKADISAGPRR